MSRNRGLHLNWQLGLGEVKTEISKRTLSLSQAAVQALKR